MAYKIKNLFLNKEIKYEFDSNRANINLERCKNIGKVLLVLNMVLLTIDVLVYKPMREDTPEYLYLYYSHIIVSMLIILWFIILRYLRDDKKLNRNKLLCNIFLNIHIYWCVFMALNSLKIHGGISAYIICVLSLAISVYLSPLENFITYFTSFVMFSVGLIYLSPNKQILYYSIINSAIVVLCSHIASNMNYKNLAKNFLNTKIILASKLELETTNLRLKEYEKLRTDFFANISHELRTPLNIIYSAEQMIELTLKNKDYDSFKMNKYSNLIKQNSFRLIRLIGNLIDLTKIDATSLEIKPINCDIINVVENVTLSVADFIETEGITVIFDTELEEKLIACDPDKIERIMLNLLSNAAKFTDTNGYIFVNMFVKDGYVCVSVRDTGIGIDPQMKNLIFERFIQEDKSIHRNKQGSGIGLSLVKSLIEMHNGTIQLNTQVGKGSEFIISLPDITLDIECTEAFFSSSNDQRIEKINIEFSDIYK